MALLTHTMMPHFSADERESLARIEGILEQHPYLRFDIDATSPVTRELEDVLSARLALLHTGGPSRKSDSDARLADKLTAWEARLVQAASDAEGASSPLMRYETAILLHPEPAQAERPNAEQRSRLTEEWERWRSQQPLRTVARQRIEQNRDFFRHGAMLPFYWARRHRIRALVPRLVLEHPALRETFFAIEQVGPLVDNFGFKGAAGVPRSTKVGLADLAFLYMQLADEFLDELAAATGGFERAGCIIRAAYRSDTSKRPLADLDLDDLVQAKINPEARPTKFGMSLASLFGVLQELADAIDDCVRAADADIAQATHLFLHHCFQTYLDEVELCERAPEHRADRLGLENTAWHFYRKNNIVMMLWLDLRARLLGLDPTAHTAAIRRWGYLLAAFQIFDDLKDIAIDLGKQPSYPLQIAANEFPSELAWLEQRFGAQRAPVTRDEVREVNLRANGTVRQCMEWSRLVALAHFDNALLYAWDQRWQKSWTRHRKSFNPVGTNPPARTGHAVDRLVRALLAVRGGDANGSVEDEQLAFALDAAAYDGSWQIYLALLPNLRAVYRFATLRMWMTHAEKADAARRLLRRYPRARSSALLGLSDGDVDHQITGDRLEAFSKLIEV
jgi:hypothetical protein